MPVPYASAETINRELPDAQPPNIHDAIALPFRARYRASPQERGARCCSSHGSARKLDPDLFVADLAPSHYVLLNKFHLLAGHVLLVTQRFERQERLTIEDSAALIACLSEVDALGFYK